MKRVEYAPLGKALLSGALAAVRDRFTVRVEVVFERGW